MYIAFIFVAVTFACDQDNMEFTLVSPEPFRGIIYTYNYYDRCYYEGKGDRTNVFKIPTDRGFQECGTRRVSCLLERSDLLLLRLTLH